MAQKSIYEGTKAVLRDNINVKDTYITLNNGCKMPIFGLGTFRIQGMELIHKTINSALKAGYRSFDTASAYGNEKDIGTALSALLPQYGLKRENIFITSKLAPRDQGALKVRNAVDKSLQNLGVDYIDLYLIHWPGAANILPEQKENQILRQESWEGLASLVEEGKLKAIGVSNYTVRHLKDLLLNSSVPPAVNQVEYHPYFHHPDELLDFCGKHNILLQAYSSFGGTGETGLLNDKTIKDISKKLNTRTSQTILRWTLQNGFAVIPKSIDEERIKENTLLDFVIPEEDMTVINKISHQHKYAWDPESVY